MLDAILSPSDGTFTPPVRTAAPCDQLLGGKKLREWDSKAIRQMITLGLALQMRDPAEEKSSTGTGQSSFPDELHAKLQSVMFWPQNSRSGCEVLIQRVMCYAADVFLGNKGVIPVLGDVQQTRLGAEFARRKDALQQQETSALGECSTRLAGKRQGALTGSPTMRDVPIDSVGSPEKDRIALLKLFEVTGGSSTWVENSGWGEDTDIGTWKGVEASNGRVQTLKLQENNLTGSIPPQLGDLTEMTELNLGKNKLTGKIPEELGRLVKLIKLRLSGNELTDEIPMTLGNAKALRQLELDHNSLSGEIPWQLGNLKELRVLMLHRNLLSGPIPPQLGGLTEMTWLQLGQNKLTGEIPKELGNLGCITVIFMDCNLLTGTIPEELGRLVNLIHLGIAQNKLRGEIPTTLGDAKALKNLDLDHNSLSGEIPWQLGNLKELRVLLLDHNLLSGVTPLWLKELDKLERFSIDANPRLQLHPDFRFERTEFHQWASRPGVLENSELIEVGEAVDTGSTSNNEKQPLPFPSKLNPGALVEAPVSTKDDDCLNFTAYAKAIADHLRTYSAWPIGVGIFAQWGAGKSSLLQFILAELGKEDIPLKRTRRDWCRHLSLRFGACSVLQALFQRCRTDPEQDSKRSDEEDPRIDSAEGTTPKKPTLTCIFASFDAWLFADSDVLWAVLISEIFKQVESHHCFGTGAVRLARVQQAVEEFSCMDWCVALLVLLSCAGVAAITVWLGGEVGDLHGASERAAAWFGLAGVPLVVVVYAIKSLTMVFRGQGEVILSKAQSMDDSVGSAHLGFMGQVRDEMKVLLDMIKDKCTKDENIVLVVSIDNLDRCPHRQIVKVLEAAHLLLEQNEAKVIVLLALDPRIVIAAIEADMDESMRQEVSGSEYLDKIIHLPFCIPVAANKDRLRLINRWLNHADDRTQDDNDPSVSGGRDGAGQRDDAELAVDDAALSAVSHQGSGGLSPDLQPPTAAATKSPRDRDCEEAKKGTGETYKADNVPQNCEVDRGYSSDHAGDGAEEGGRRVLPDPLVTRTASPGQGEEKVPLSPQLATPTRSISPRASGDQDALREDSEADPGGTNDADSAISINGDGDRLVPPTTHRLGLVRAVSTLTHTEMEIDELKAFMSMLGATPRKAKRVFNIYSVQRSLARNTIASFTQDDARKILRWTILSEFWPFRSACIIGCIARETHERSEASKKPRIISVYDLYRSRAEKEIIPRMIGQRRSHAPTVAGDDGIRVASDLMHEPNSYEMPAARKLLGMDESDYTILRVLKSAPPLLLEDFDEDKLGLVGLSFNLNPALVAKVAAWTRSCWDPTD